MRDSSLLHKNNLREMRRGKKGSVMKGGVGRKRKGKRKGRSEKEGSEGGKRVVNDGWERKERIGREGRERAWDGDS